MGDSEFILLLFLILLRKTCAQLIDLSLILSEIKLM